MLNTRGKKEKMDELLWFTVKYVFFLTICNKKNILQFINMCLCVYIEG